MCIEEKAMLVKLSISMWTARKHDKRATATVESTYHTTAAGRFNKVLIAQDAIQEVSKAANAARSFHYENTLPWTDEGYRLLPSKNFDFYSAEMRKLKAVFERAVEKFSSNYNALVDDARVRLNGLFNQTDYPLNIRSKFDFETAISPVPSKSDFRVDVGNEETAKIRADIEIRTKNAAADAHRDLYRRLAETVNHIADRLRDEKAVFRDSLVNNLIKLCELIPRLNINSDPELEKLRKEAEEKLCLCDPQTLRNDKQARKRTARDASAILEAMGGIYAA